VIEIRFHGRGGQGAVIASELLAQAAFLDGKVPQSFPFFGVERRGAPVTAFTRIDDRPIGVRTSVTAPHLVVVLDPGLLSTTPVADGLRPDGLLLVNTPLAPEAIMAPTGARRATVDATRIALSRGLGSSMMPIVNTALLGALAGATAVVSMDALHQAIGHFVPAAPEANWSAAQDGYSAVRVVDTGAALSPPTRAPPLRAYLFPEGPVASVSSEVIHTAAWRTFTPVIDLPRCTKCNFCWKFCPDDAIEFDPAGYPRIKLDYCKGCGICAAECPPKAIEMVAVA
jgi:pyruvate ferredoxin oxidoreductase gamma subunit